MASGERGCWASTEFMELVRGDPLRRAVAVRATTAAPFGNNHCSGFDQGLGFAFRRVIRNKPQFDAAQIEELARSTKAPEPGRILAAARCI